MAFCLNKFPPMTMHPLFQSLNKIETRIPSIIAHVCCTPTPKILQNKTTSHTRQYRPRAPVLIPARSGGGGEGGEDRWGHLVKAPFPSPHYGGRRRAHWHTIYPTPSLSLHPVVKTGPEQNVPHPTHHLWLPFQDRTGSAQDVPIPLPLPLPPSWTKLQTLVKILPSMTIQVLPTILWSLPAKMCQSHQSLLIAHWVHEDFDVDLSLIGSKEMILKTCFVLHMCLIKTFQNVYFHPRSCKSKFLKMNTSHKMLQTKVPKKLNLSQKNLPNKWNKRRETACILFRSLGCGNWIFHIWGVTPTNRYILRSHRDNLSLRKD